MNSLYNFLKSYNEQLAFVHTYVRVCVFVCVCMCVRERGVVALFYGISIFLVNTETISSGNNLLYTKIESNLPFHA